MALYDLDEAILLEAGSGAITIGVLLSLRSATEKEEDPNMDVVITYLV
jgi:hypothetical protein